jgi:hypothetical protein
MQSHHLAPEKGMTRLTLDLLRNITKTKLEVGFFLFLSFCLLFSAN